MNRVVGILVPFLMVISLVLSACSGAAPAPTAAPAATPTSPPAATKAPEAAKPQPSNTPAAAAQKPTSLTVVKAGITASVAYAGYFVALERGYFKEEGLDAQSEFFNSLTQMIPAVSTGQIQVASGATGAGLFNAINRGADVRLVGSLTKQAPGFGTLALAVRKDLIDSGQFKDYKDLKGKRVAVAAKASASEIALDKALGRGQLTLKDVELIEMGLPDMTAAFANKSIDAAMQNEPPISQSVANGVAVRWKGVDELYPNMELSVWLYGPQFVGPDAEVGKRWMVAFLKGVRDFDRDFIKGKARDQIVPMLIKYTTVKDPKLYDTMAPPFSNPNGSVDPKLVTDDQDWYVSHGYVTQKADLKTIIDSRFADSAVQKLGQYK